MTDTLPWPYQIPGGSELKAYRNTLGVTQAAVAEKSDLHPRTIQKIETDTDTVTVTSLRSYLAVLRALMAERQDGNAQVFTGP